jgi:hypothetical protein
MFPDSRKSLEKLASVSQLQLNEDITNDVTWVVGGC